MLQVDDESTSVLMEQMYHHLMDGRTTVAQALRLAMLHLLRRPPSPLLEAAKILGVLPGGGCYDAPAVHHPV